MFRNTQRTSTYSEVGPTARLKAPVRGFLAGIRSSWSAIVLQLDELMCTGTLGCGKVVSKVKVEEEENVANRFFTTRDCQGCLNCR